MLAIGAVAGCAAGVLLAVLSVLYVSQARDVKRLRAWAGHAPERSAADVSAGLPPASVTAPARRSQRRIGIRSVAVLLVLAAATYGVSRAAGGGDSSTTRGPSRKPKRSVAVKPATVTVAVLNGTTVNGLAATLSDQLAAAGFQQGAIDVFSDQQLAESLVEYAPGHLDEAKAVGRVVGISRREPVTASSRALARDATVIVVAGADKAS